MDGWKQILANSQRCSNHQLAVDLASELSSILEIPLTEFSITDSLLWGEGHDESDIDLLVDGQQNATRLIERRYQIYEQVDFARPNPEVMTSPYGITVADWPSLLNRKLHMGEFRGRLFSLRAIRPANASSVYQPRSSTSVDSIEFTVADVEQSLFFPAIYLNDQGDQLVDYSVVYEGVFRVGETVKCRAFVEDTDSSFCKFIIDGECTICRTAAH
ncbi:MAG: hypothetical protein AAF497_21420 [Planctomycetota bacterium]